jgi:hypothetical protein
MAIIIEALANLSLEHKTEKVAHLLEQSESNKAAGENKVNGQHLRIHSGRAFSEEKLEGAEEMIAEAGLVIRGMNVNETAGTVNVTYGESLTETFEDFSARLTQKAVDHKESMENNPAYRKAHLSKKFVDAVKTGERIAKAKGKEKKNSEKIVTLGEALKSLGVSNLDSILKTA